jgi:CheY-like chemotaxis protein
MDGFECARRIRAQSATIRILALSATTVREELDAVTAAGMNGFLAKPVRIENLRDALPPAAKSTLKIA